jgi:hypothetical protein
LKNKGYILKNKGYVLKDKGCDFFMVAPRGIEPLSKV